MIKPITQTEWEQRIKERFPTENFKIINYTSLKKPMDIQCEQCQQIIHVNNAGNFLAKNKAYGCKNCHGFQNERDELMKQLLERYTIISSDVRNTHTYYTVKCKNCGHERTSTLRNLIRHLECGCKTGVLRKRSADEFQAEIQEVNIMKFELVSDYVNQSTKVLVRHKDCGFIFSAWPHDLVMPNKKVCPKCSKSISKRELLIADYFNQRHIEYEREKRLSNGQRLDFYLENDTYKLAIEYNGEQHYKTLPIFAPVEIQQERDSRKAEYCQNNNIDLIILPYYLTNEEIFKQLDSIIDKFNDYSK